MTENNAAQPGLTDDEIRVEIHNAIGFAFDPGETQEVNAADLMNVAHALLSKLRAEGVQAGDERAFQLIQDLHAFAAHQRWFGEHGYESVGASVRLEISNALFARLRAALASAPVADERECGNADCGWRGTTERMCGSVGPLCPECGETTEASAPVAGEAIPPGYALIPVKQTPEMHDAVMNLLYAGVPRTNTQSLLDAYIRSAPAAPQASEAVRILFPAHLRKMWSGGEVRAWLDEYQGLPSVQPSAKGSLGRYRQWQAEQTQADKDGGDCAKGAGDVAMRDAAFEAVRKRLCAIPRYSFYLDDDGVVRRVEGRSGNWIEFDAAHELFDPVAVDAALAAQKQGDSDE